MKLCNFIGDPLKRPSSMVTLFKYLSDVCSVATLPLRALCRLLGGVAQTRGVLPYFIILYYLRIVFKFNVKFLEQDNIYDE